MNFTRYALLREAFIIKVSYSLTAIICRNFIIVSINRFSRVLYFILRGLFCCVRLLAVEVPVVVDEASEYVQARLRLIHRHHVPRIEDSQEVMVSVLAHVSDCLTIQVHGYICLGVKVCLVLPFGGSRPVLALTPVDHPVFVSTVGQHLNVCLV